MLLLSDHAYVHNPEKKLPVDTTPDATIDTTIDTTTDAASLETVQESTTDSPIESLPPPVETELPQLDVAHEVLNTEDTVENIQYLIEMPSGDTITLPFIDMKTAGIDMKVEYVTDIQDVIEETVITQEMIDQVLPLNPE